MLAVGMTSLDSETSLIGEKYQLCSGYDSKTGSKQLAIKNTTSLFGSNKDTHSKQHFSFFVEETM